MLWRYNRRQKVFLAHIGPIRSGLISYCRHLLWDRTELDDAVQTVVLTAFEKFDDFLPGTEFRAWVFRIATNVVMNSNRRHAREQERIVDKDPEELDIVAVLQSEYAYEELLRDPDLVLEQVGDEMSVALRLLPPHERAVFLLKIIGDMTCREIAETLEMPIGSVMGYLSRARGTLRSHLSEYAKQYGFLSNEIKEGSTNGLPEA